jgi:steroid delta-isomerase-like uncharacterized protein
MSTQQNKAILKRFISEVNKGNFNVMDELFAEDLVDWYPSPGATPSREGFKQNLIGTRKTFPDFHWSLEDIIAEGDKVVYRLMMQGTDTGGFMGMPPTGKKVSFAGISILRFAHGKAVERWYIGDNMTALHQLGLL